MHDVRHEGRHEVLGRGGWGEGVCPIVVTHEPCVDQPRMRGVCPFIVTHEPCVDQPRMRGVCLIIVTHEPCVDHPRIHRIMSCIDAILQILQSQVFGQDITKRTSSFFVGHCPLVSTLTST